MAKTWAECEPIETIVHNHAEKVYDGYFLSTEDYHRMLDELKEREEAIVNDFIREDN